MEAEEEATCMAVSSDMLVDGIIQNKPQSPDLLVTHDALSDQTMDAACSLPPSCRSVMLDRVAHSDGHFKHQQRDEPDLTHSEKLHIATELLDNKPGAFLTRFGKFLEAEDLVNFETLSDDYIIGFQLKEIRTRLNVSANQTMVKNRRYEAMKRLVEQGEYFGDELLKERDPLLYEQMVGQHLDGAEISALVNKSDLRFSTILLAHLDIIRNNELYEKQKEIEAAQMMDESGSEKSETEESEEESELESEDEDGHTRSKISAEEKRMLREDFVTTMKHRFLNGEDINFDYSEVDTNEEYDSLDIQEHDEQERYFDNEEPQTLDMESDAQNEAVPNPMVDRTRTSEDGPDITTGCNEQLANLHEKQKEPTLENMSSVHKLTHEDT